MSRESIYTDLFGMLTDMVVANGYSRNYTPVKSVDNDSATMAQTPYISVHLGYETELTEGRAVNQYRAEVPVIVTARILSTHTTTDQKEYEYDRERSMAIDDIKARFSNAPVEIAGCITLEPLGEEEPKKDSNKNSLFVRYVFTMTYKQARKLPTPPPPEGD